MTKRRPLALSAAAVLGFGSLFIAAPAMAEDVSAAPQDPTAAALAAVAEINSSVETSDPAVGAGTSTAGEPIVFVDDASAIDDAVLASVAENHGVDKVVISGNVVQDASTDVVAGAGYFSPLNDGSGRVGTCSIGFTGFSPTGEPALISAGHCTSDGSLDDVQLSLPSADAAGGSIEPDGNGVIGSFGFSQFGGVNNSVGADEDPNSTDIAVIDVTNDAIDLHPEVTDWSTANQNDLSQSTTVVKNVGLPKSGTVSKSGRTTGLTSGNTLLNMPVRYSDGSTGIEPVELLDGYMQVSGRWVHGFLGGAVTSPGDSGGAVFQGETAVGVVSGGPESVPAGADDYAWYTLLQPALGFTNGYTVALDIDAPTVATDLSNGVATGSDIVVNVPSNATQLSFGQTGANAGDSIPVSGGTATISAPAEPGEYSYTFTATNGFSASEPVQVDFEVKIAPPTIDATEFTSNEVTLSGTGVAEANLNLELKNGAGAAENHALNVQADGKWSVDVELGYGEFDYTLNQSINSVESADNTGTISVRPAQPGNTSIANESVFPVGEGPTTLTGSGIDGATVSLEFTEGTQPAGLQNTTQVEGDEWSFDFGAPLPSGDYTLTIAQSVTNEDVAPPVDEPVEINGRSIAPNLTAQLGGVANEVVTSDPTVITFVVAAAVDPGANAGGAADGGSAAGGGADGTAGAGGGAADGTATAGGGAGAGAGANGTAGAGASGTAGAGTGADGAKLVNTGFDAGSLVPFGIAALGMLVLGAGAIVLTQRRLRATESE